MNATSTPRRVTYYVILVVIVGLMLTPFVWVFFGSFKTQSEFISDPGAWFPQSFQVQNYITLFTEQGFGTYLSNSIIVSVVAIASNLLFCSMAGYALDKLRFPGKQFVFPLVVMSMTVPYVALFVPQFILIVQLGFVDTLVGIVLPSLVMPLCVFIMRQFAHSVPYELLEAARLDGASELRLFARIFLPLSGPALATVGILSFLTSWNNFLWPLVVAQTNDTYTLPVALALYSTGQNQTEYGLLMAGATVVVLPVLIVFLIFQRRFIQGIATTGIK